MDLTAEHMHAAIRNAVDAYRVDLEDEEDDIEPAWLLPLAVLVVDRLAPHLPGPQVKPYFLCVKGMLGDGNLGPAVASWRKAITMNEGGSFLKYVEIGQTKEHQKEEHVDLNLLDDGSHPWTTVLSVESEADFKKYVKTLDAPEPTDNGYLWDFYKLLKLPSPVRLMVTLCPAAHQPRLLARMHALLLSYSGSASLAESTDVWSISLPTSPLSRSKVAIHRWAPNVHGAGPVDHSKLFPA